MRSLKRREYSQANKAHFDGKSIFVKDEKSLVAKEDKEALGSEFILRKFFKNRGLCEIFLRKNG